MKKTIWLLLGLAFAAPLKAQQKIYDITTYGAKADSTTYNTQYIQQAIDKASAAGGGKVYVPAGKFLTSVLHLKSGVELHLAEHAMLLATTRRMDYGPAKASAFIVADNQQNISITGKGTIDGHGEQLLEDIFRVLKQGILKDAEWQQYNDWGQMRPAENNRPKLICFTNCDNVTVKGITIQNGLCWIQDYRSCTNMLFDSIRVLSNTFLNNDGIDLVDCKNVKLTNSFFDVADDGICLKSHNPQSWCENIYIANCTVRSSASALKMGTASFGGFKKITVNGIYVYDTFRSAIAIETVDGGAVEDIDIRNVTARNTGNAIFIRLGKRRAERAPGTLKGIYIGNVKVQIPAGKPDAGYNMEGPRELYEHNVFPSSITGIPGHPVENITLENIEVEYALKSSNQIANINTDSLQNIPENIAAYPEFSMFRELPAWGFYVRHANNITLKNIRLGYTGKEFRTGCIFDDVNKLALQNVQITKAASTPVLILNNVTAPVLEKVQTPVEEKSAIQIRH
jgi:polygalacturonase